MPSANLKNSNIAWVRRATLKRGTKELQGVWFDGTGCIASDQRRIHVWDDPSLEHTELPYIDPPNPKVRRMPNLRAVMPPRDAEAAVIEPAEFAHAIQTFKHAAPILTVLTHIQVQYQQPMQRFMLQPFGTSHRAFDYKGEPIYIPCDWDMLQPAPTTFAWDYFRDIFDSTQPLAYWTQQIPYTDKAPLRVDFFDGRAAVLLPCINIFTKGWILP